MAPRLSRRSILKGATAGAVVAGLPGSRPGGSAHDAPEERGAIVYVGVVTGLDRDGRLGLRPLSQPLGSPPSRTVRLEPGGSVWLGRPATLEDLQPGDEVVVTGSRQGDGSLLARRLESPLYPRWTTAKAPARQGSITTPAGALRYDAFTRPVPEPPFDRVAVRQVQPGQRIFALVRVNRDSGAETACQFGAY
jgi:hypothetical protein